MEPARPDPPSRAPAQPVDTVIAGGWLLTMNPSREIYRAGGIAIRDGAIVAVGPRAGILAAYAPARLIVGRDAVITPGLVNGHRHLLCCAKGAMPEGGQTLSALRQFIYPSFAALTEDDMGIYARHDAVRGAGLHPPRGRARGARRRGHPGPDRPLDLGPGGPGRRRRAARLA